MAQGNERYVWCAVALFILACILALKWPSIAETIRRGQEQAHLEKLDLNVGRVTYRNGYITGLSFSKMDGGKITDKDLAKLVEFEKLEDIDLRGNPITSDGLSHLSNLESLQSLNLERTRIDDAGMRHLVALGDLRWLNLQSTMLSDSGLEELKHIATLQFIVLVETDVTDEGIEKLQLVLPDCRIAHLP